MSETENLRVAIANARDWHVLRHKAASKQPTRDTWMQNEHREQIEALDAALAATPTEVDRAPPPAIDAPPDVAVGQVWRTQSGGVAARTITHVIGKEIWYIDATDRHGLVFRKGFIAWVRKTGARPV